jgi:hypothetical protein
MIHIKLKNTNLTLTQNNYSIIQFSEETTEIRIEEAQSFMVVTQIKESDQGEEVFLTNYSYKTIHNASFSFKGKGSAKLIIDEQKIPIKLDKTIYSYNELKEYIKIENQALEPALDTHISSHSSTSSIENDPFDNEYNVAEDVFNNSFSLLRTNLHYYNKELFDSTFANAMEKWMDSFYNEPMGEIKN